MWRFPVLSTLNSTLPFLASSIAFLTSGVTVPVLGLGINPLGPKILPSLATLGIISGVAMTTSNCSTSTLPLRISSTSSSPPTRSAPASSASLIFSPLAITITLIGLPNPWGRTTEPLTCWSGYLGSTPNLKARSTVSSKFLGTSSAIFLRISTASSRVYLLFLSTNLALSMYFFPLLAIG